MTECNIGGCAKQVHGRGMCTLHYQRWQRHGDPLAGGTWYATPEEAFLARTEPIVGDPGCIIWTGATTRKGYGQLSVNGRLVMAHRFAWEQVHGQIPEGMVIDHVCFERSCVNTEHLRLATIQQNNAYLSGARKGRDLPRGVTRHGRGYAAQVRNGGVRHWLGTFDTVESASRAAETKRQILFGEFAGGA